MSKRILLKKGKKLASSTLLIVGEGLIDKAFINYLKSLYYERGSNYRIKIEAGIPSKILYLICAS